MTVGRERWESPSYSPCEVMLQLLCKTAPVVHVALSPLSPKCSPFQSNPMALIGNLITAANPEHTPAKAKISAFTIMLN